MLLFRLAPLTGDSTQGRYIGTDISTTALQYIDVMKKRPEYESLNINVAKIGAHEVDQVCAPKECDIVLCNGVTMYFPSAAYLIDSMRMSADVTKPGGRVFYGDIQSQKQRRQLSYMQFTRWPHGRNFRTLTTNFSSGWIQWVMQTFLVVASSA